MKYLLLLTTVLLLLSCKKKDEQQYGTYELRLCDSPGNYEHVYLDIQQVSVMVEGIGWEDLATSVGVVDLLEYNNGLDLLLGSKLVPVGKLIQIRLILGPNNTLVENGNSHTLVIPSASQSGVKINVDTDISPSATTIEWLDVDAGRSIMALPNGTYKMTPVLRTFKASNNGRFKGYVLPVEANAHIQAIKGNDTIIAIPEDDGFYQLSGLQGNYKLRFVPGIGTYNTVDMDDNSVTGNQIITVPNITL